MDDHAVIQLLGLGKQSLHRLVIVAVGGAQVVEADILEVVTAVHGVFEGLLGVADGAEQAVTHQGDLLDEAGDALLGLEIARFPTEARHVGGEAADVLGDGHLVFVDDDDEPQAGGDVVQRLMDHTAREGTVADDGHSKGLGAAHTVALGKAQRGRQGSRAVPRAEAVVLALAPLGEARKAAALTDGGELLIASRQELVDVALVAYVEDEVVAGAVENTVHGHRQLHGSQIGGEVAAVLGDGLHQGLADLLAESGDGFCGQSAQVGGGMDMGQVLFRRSGGLLGGGSLGHGGLLLSG